ncbi:BTAD domain-containing putative transcriptional regulator [Azospirillum soli]|uniref:BTAD domain-containing putative transcriptional regulator n=1 Tax=Azospirillum soli TaxID=1304799 RepID=UPI001AEB9920|nr:BTAD domain-containing putative transcriptional regulator [Azospirillum soli]MBP2316169.1 DNA-binding SARP family transcriptional activator/class 3 adenylate cyclase [Azospirillum soli]
MGLLAYLALRPDQAQSREKLAGLLWGDSSDAQARSSLRQVIATLRRTFPDEGAPVLRVEGELVALIPGAMETDAVAFEQAIAEGTPDALDRAATLYRGDLFEGLLLNADIFESWLMVERQRLREMALSAMARRLDQALAAGATEAGVRTALRLLALDPLQEPAHRALMQLYARQGRHTVALKQYQACRAMLEQELGVLPEPETERVYRAIRERRHARNRKEEQAPAGMPSAEPLPEGQPKAPPSPETPAPEIPAPEVPGPEVRHGTILCVSLAGMERVGAALDPEDAHAFTTGLFDRIGGIVADYGGETLRHAGDTALAAFGVRRAFGDEPWRAVRAALEIHASLGDATKEHSVREYPVTARTGVACGMVVVDGAGGHAVTGRAMHDAPRLAALAAPGETLVCDGVRGALGERIGVQPAATAGDGRAVWRLTGLHNVDVVLPQRPLVGRQAELRQFGAALAACRETGGGTTIQLRGEPGIGKSRLIEEFKSVAVSQGVRCAAGAVVGVGVGRGQDALRALMRGLAGSPAELDRLFAEGRLPEGARLHLPPLIDQPQPPELRRTYEALDHPARDRGRRDTMADLVRARSAEQPVLLVVEDVHWADAQVLSYLAMLAGVVADCPAVLTLSTRVQGDPLGAEWRTQVAGGPVLTLDLAPLRRAEALTLAGHYADAGDPYAERCVARAGGNPLFLEQLLRSREDEATVPGTIHGIVLTRTDALAPRDRRALQAASVLGQRFALDALRHMIGDPGYGCAPLIGQALVRPDGPDGREFLFAHALVQEAVYGALLRSQRTDLHRQAASWYAARDPVRHAEHLDRAEDPGAAAAYRRAAEACAADFRFERAMGLADRGLELAATPPERFALACLRAELLESLGEVHRAAEAFAEARALATDHAERSRACLGLAAAKRVTEDLDGAMATLAEAEEAAVAAGLLADRARIHHMRGNLCFPRGDLEGCLREHRAALDWARQAGAADLETAALGGLGDAHYAHGRMATAHEHFARCVALARQQGLRRVEVSNLYMVAITRLYLNNLHGAAGDARAGARAAQAIGHRRAELLSHICAYEVLLELGEEDAGRDHLARARALTQQLGAHRFEAEHLLFEARLERAAGNPESACARLHRAMEIAHETGPGYIGPSILAELALCCDDPAARRAALDEGEGLLAGGSVGHNHLQFYREAIDTALDLADWALAERYAGALEAYAGAEPLPWCTLFAARGRALAAWGGGRRDEEARAALVRVLEECRDAGYVPPVARLEAALRG